MTPIGANTATRVEERRILQETLLDRDNNGLTEEECERLNRIFAAAPPPPLTYAEVWADQRARDEGRLLMAEARLRATMARQPPSPSLPSSTAGTQSCKAGANSDDLPNPHRPSPEPSAAESQPPPRSNGSTEVAHWTNRLRLRRFKIQIEHADFISDHRQPEHPSVRSSDRFIHPSQFEA